MAINDIQYDANKTLPPSSDDWIYLKNWEKYRLQRVASGSTDPILKMNRFKLLTDKNEGYSAKGYIFVTKPDLNIFTDDGSDLLDDVAAIPLFRYVYSLPVGREILRSLSRSSSESTVSDTPWLSVLTNSAVNYNIGSDREIETVQVGKTYHDFTINYGHTSFKHMSSGDQQIQFIDNRDMITYWTIRLWCEYIHNVAYGHISPKKKYIHNAILDYAVSLYYVLVDETMENIIYWEKLTGLFPTKTPDSTWSYENGNEYKDLKYDIEFKYSMRSVLDEFDLLELDNQYIIQVTADNYAISGCESVPGTIHAGHAGSDAHNALKYLIAWYNKSDINTINQAELEKYYYSNTSKNVYTRFKNNYFLPNYIPELGVHGIPYVRGPFIVKSALNDASNYGKNILRWV